MLLQGLWDLRQAVRKHWPMAQVVYDNFGLLRPDELLIQSVLPEHLPHGALTPGMHKSISVCRWQSYLASLLGCE